MFLSQVINKADDMTVVVHEGDIANVVNGAASTYVLVLTAIQDRGSLAQTIAKMGLGIEVDFPQALADTRVKFSIHHADPSHLHITERGNYLLLAHSKLRQASYDPKIFVDELPCDIQDKSRILRGRKTLWEKQFLSEKNNISHSIANLEHHHFKYDLFRQSDDLHIHFFGTATLSFADGISTKEGDIFEIEAPQLGFELRNPLVIDGQVSSTHPVTSL